MAYEDRLVVLEATRFRYNHIVGKGVLLRVQGARRLQTTVVSKTRLERFAKEGATLQELFDAFSNEYAADSERARDMLARKVLKACSRERAVSPILEVFLRACVLEILATHGSVIAKEISDRLAPMAKRLGETSNDLRKIVTEDMRSGKFIHYDERYRLFELKQEGLEMLKQYANNYCKPLLDKTDPEGTNIFQKKVSLTGL